jgi:hypothetical protein
MTDPAVVTAALALASSHRHAPARDVLDLAMQGARVTLDDLGDHTHPSAPFGQLLAVAFDHTPPADWAAWTGPAADPVLRNAMMQIWRHEVLGVFVVRYAVSK